jgi:hypothetical protein
MNSIDWAAIHSKCAVSSRRRYDDILDISERKKSEKIITHPTVFSTRRVTYKVFENARREI